MEVSSIMDSAGFEALDDIIMSEMNLLQEFLKIRAELSRSLQLGYHLLAKARYVMGKQRVSSAQLPGSGETVTASSTVSSHLPPDSDCYYFSLHSMTSDKSDVTDGKTEAIFRGSSSQDSHSENGEKKKEPHEPEKNEHREQCSQQQNGDPLRWFGVLVPQELKLAQSAFKRATELSVEVANMQIKIEHKSQQFRSIVQRAATIRCADEP